MMQTRWPNIVKLLAENEPLHSGCIYFDTVVR